MDTSKSVTEPLSKNQLKKQMAHQHNLAYEQERAAKKLREEEARKAAEEVAKNPHAEEPVNEESKAMESEDIAAAKNIDLNKAINQLKRLRFNNYVQRKKRLSRKKTNTNAYRAIRKQKNKVARKQRKVNRKK